ncbi:Putative PAS/PAC sensor protein [hydrothermal vent metagenome]|uniref:PAS/PAC sensor protein n=1 Tax=hydrothermal vent metagenome TaxID=652676 RepID=A0A3B1B7S0_9ZZZZ
MSEFLLESKVEYLIEIIRSICAGNIPEKEIQQFRDHCDSLSSDEINEVFTQLANENVPYETNPQVIAFYHDVMEEKIASSSINTFAPGHPVRVYLEENRLLRSYLSQLRQIDPRCDKVAFHAMFQKICTAELHFARKENQLFPLLEKHGWDSPSKNMWAFHDDIRAKLKEIRIALEEDNIDLVVEQIPYLQSEMQRLMGVEEERLLPNAMNMLTDSEWEDMRLGDEEIGWILDEVPPPFPAITEEIEGITEIKAKVEAPKPRRLKSTPKKQKELPFSIEDADHFDEGYLTPEQVNFIFKFLPVDITYVNEDDRVVFYNRGDDRVFPRSANIIGREVKLCHPPKSVDNVLRILEEFKKGTKDHAAFWINMRGKFIHIRYFAVRDEQKKYRGVIEMSQDVTEIRALEGEQRLLDWD